MHVIDLALILLHSFKLYVVIIQID